MTAFNTSALENYQCCIQEEKETLDTVRKPLVNDDLYLFIMSITLGIICQTVTVFGTAGNIINITLFIKQGFSDSINISLLALAISDLSSLLTIMWSNLCFSPAVRDSAIPMITYEVHLITGSWPHVVFTRITGWITAFISFERCICVIHPLKVKALFTPRRHIIVMVAIYGVTLASHSMAYFSAGLAWFFDPINNRTLIRLTYLMSADKRHIADSISYAINGVFMPVSCFLSVVICTVFLVVKLNEKAAWRNSNSSATTQTNSKSEASMGSRDQKIAKMIVLISVMFITCFIPAVVTFIAGITEPELTYDGVYKNIFLVTLSISFTTEAFNSSINICIYFSMSSKYRQAFLSLFRCKKSPAA